MPDLGDTLPFSSKLYDKPVADGGVLVNATTAALAITLPDGTAAPGITVTNPPAVTGTYAYDYSTTTVPGRFTGRWLFTMATGKTSAYVEEFDVRPADPGYVMSLASVKEHLNIPASKTSDDEELRGWLEAVTRLIESRAGEVCRKSFTERHGSGGSLWLRHPPVLSVTTIEPWLSAGTTYAAADVRVAESGRVERPGQPDPGRENHPQTLLGNPTRRIGAAASGRRRDVHDPWVRVRHPEPGDRADGSGSAVRELRLMATKLAAVGNSLIALFSGLPALAGVAVYNGSPVSSAADLDLVLVNDDGDPASDASSTFEQEWANLAATSRYERGTVVCAVISQSGDTDLQDRQDRAEALLDACEAALHADVTLGGLVMTAQISSGSARPIQNSAGSAVVAPFTISYFAQV